MEPLGRLIFDQEYGVEDFHHDEHTPLLSDSELLENGVTLPEATDANGHVTKSHDALPVFANIHAIRKDVLDNIDDPYSEEQLRSPRMNNLILRPMVDRWHSKNDISIVYCFLVNRAQFLREQERQLHHQTVASTRAMLCEIIASRILRRFDEDNPGPAGLLLMANILVAGFWPFQNAPQDAVETHHNLAKWTRMKQDTTNRKSTALEIAIISDSKTFLSSTPCQKVVEAIYQGRVVYTPTSYMDLIPDYYKRRPITLYDPRTRPLLNQYRLVVPRTRNVLELISFVVLLGLYIAVMDGRDPTRLGVIEIVFCIYAWGWVLEQFASMIEHGWKVYTQNLWAFLDVVFILVYTAYFGVRMHAYRSGDEDRSQLAFHILASGAPVLIPRLAFNLLSENMLFVSLRAMMSNFLVLSLLAVWCFAGFLLAMNWMGNGVHGPLQISKWMLYVWFGLDGTGVQKSVEFHWLLGPVLMVTFAFLGNTLFLTILVSMLSHTFAKIVVNATAEIQFRRAVLTFECVKGDAIFAFFPPFNIPALVLLLPMKLLLSPRWFHKVVVTAVRVLNAPILLALGLYERRALWSEERARQRRAALAISNPTSPAAVQAREERMKPSRWPTWDMSNFNVHADIQEVFETAPEADPEEDHDAGIDEREDPDPTFTTLNTPAVERRGSGYFGAVAGPSANVGDGVQDSGKVKATKRRRDSMALAPFSEVTEHLHELLADYGGVEGNRERIDKVEVGLRRVEGKIDKLVELLGGKSESVGRAPRRRTTILRSDSTAERGSPLAETPVREW